MKKGETTIPGLIIGLLLFSVVILGMISFQTDLFNNNNVESNLSNKLSSLDYVNATFENTKGVQEKIAEASETNSTDYLGLLSYMTFQGVLISFKSLGSYIVLISSLPASELHIPVYVSTVIITILLVAFVFLIASAIMRWRM